MSPIFFSDHRCRELVGDIIFDPTYKFAESSYQHKMPNPNGRSCCFDLHMKDVKGNLYNVEIQGYSSGAVPQRPRYHASLLNTSLKVEDNKWKDLPNVKVAFVCHKDYIGDGKRVYHIKRVVDETGKNFNDGEEIIYINGEIIDESREGRMVYDFNCKDPNKMYYKEFRRRMKEIKETKKGREEMCQALEKLVNEEREEGFNYGRTLGKSEGIEVGRTLGKSEGKLEGIEIGKVEGITIGKEEIARSMLKEGLPLESIVRYTGLSLENLQRLRFS